MLAHPLPPALLTRLTREQGWTPAFAARAAHEYLRFVLLAAVSGHPVTPPRAVDEVWHLHLTFTRDDWERLTPLLPGALHHDPAGDRCPALRTQYEATLDAYARMFGEAPPADLWPDPRRSRPAARVLGSTRRTGLNVALGAAFVTGLTFAWSPLVLWLAAGAFLLVLLCTRLPAASAGHRGRAALAGSGSDGADFTGAHRTHSDCGPGDSGGGDSGGAGCGSSCGS
ncbi:hypothetical protein LAJ19_09595 [Deinococcus taeanensis]|uniref:glycine-rich domain-containing protein n=1 Tax=Deinococcus taeanensis TaxID=2737050 RepID=UPI001CDCD7B8|nr:hypothetical protein [Deinococcus taeanensis]UBV41896.1 hypothetical protein LAJ19_09595 [Deinococcus taeanensis]